MGKLETTLQRELSRLIPSLTDPRIPVVVTVERVRLSPDGRQARVLVSALEEDEGEMLEALNGASGYLQRELAADLNLRYTPKLSFFSDELKVL